MSRASSRIRISVPPSPLPLIQPIGDVMALLGQPVQVDALVRHLTRKNGTGLPVSDKTLRAAATGPVTPKTAHKIGAILEAVLPYTLSKEDIEAISRPWLDLNALANGFSWQAGVLLPIDKLAPPEYSTLRSVRFLRERIEQEFQLVSRLKILTEEKASPGRFQKAFYESFRAATLVEDGILLAGTEPIAAWGRGATVDESASRALRRLFLHMTVDFHYALLASFDHDLCEAVTADAPEGSVPTDIAEHGLFGDLIPAHQAGGYTEPLAVLLDKWRTVYAGEDSQPLRWADLYRCLPYPHGIAPEDRAEFACVDDARAEIDESRRSQFNAWRTGQKRPSKDQMDAFLARLVPAGCDNRWPSLQMYWAGALGRLIKRERESGIFPAGLIPDIKVTQAFCGYRKYWAHYAAD